MKASRVVVICLGALLVVALLAVVVVLNSTFQTWAARKALASQHDLRASLGSVSAGLKRVEVRDLRIESHGAVLTLPALDTELPVLAAGFQNRVQISKLVAKGWTLDLTRAESAASPASNAKAAAPSKTALDERHEFSLLPSAHAASSSDASAAVVPVFRGVVAGLRLPVDFSLDGLELDGEVILPAAQGRPAGKVHVNLRGGGMSAGHDGSFVIASSGEQPDGGRLALQGVLTASMDTPRTFTGLSLKADATASGSAFPKGVALKIDATALRTQTGEAYDVALAGGSKHLADVRAQLLNAKATISGQWTMDLRDSDLSAFTFGRQLPAFEANGEGTFETDTTLKEVHATGRLNGSLNKLEVIRPELSAVGAMSLSADFDVLQHANSIRVERFDAAINGTHPVATVHALQPFEFNLDSENLQLSVADPARDLVSVKLAGLPLAWVRAFSGDLEITGGDLKGELTASARDGGLAARTQTPLTLENASISQAGKPLLQSVALSLDASADYFASRAWQAQVTELVLRDGAGGTLFSLNGKAGQQSGKDQPIKSTGRWTADLRGWSAQPIAVGKFSLAGGEAQGDFTASLDGTRALETRLVLSKLVASTKESLPVVTAEIRADIGADGRITFNVPILFEQTGRKSDLLFAGTLVPGTPAPTLEARLSSDQVIVEDVKLLGLLLPAETPAETKRPEDADTAPFWGSLQGQISLALKKVIYANSFEVSDVGGVLRLDAAELKLDAVHAAFGPESDLKMNGSVAFEPSAAERYRLASNLAVTNFDAAPAFRAFNPATLPTIEGRLNLTGQVTGAGANLALLAEQAQGKFDVVSKGGIFRALATVLPADKIGGAQSALSLVGGLLGGSAGNSLNAAAEIVKQLSEIHFDQLSLSTERDANLNLILKDFSLISPDIRLGGVGQIRYVPGKSLLDQALDLQISLGARGRLGELFSQVKMLKAEKDSLGYVALNAPIKISGTLARTDTSDLKTKLLNAALEKTGVGDAIEKLFGGGKNRP
jgi:hypothetical protein